MRQTERDHPVLGRLGWNSAIGCWEMRAELVPGCSVNFAVDGRGESDAADPEELFTAAARYLDWARQAEPACRQRIADDCLDIYNQGWADDDPDEGPPPLSRPEFIAHLRPVGITLCRDGSADWIYEPDDLFAGHGISVWVGADRVFGKAALFG